MTYNLLALLGDERDGQGTGSTQGVDDVLLRVRRVRCIQECGSRYSMDSRSI
jgi:hypothetical protein